MAPPVRPHALQAQIDAEVERRLKVELAARLDAKAEVEENTEIVNTDGRLSDEGIAARAKKRQDAWNEKYGKGSAVSSSGV